MLKDIRDFEDVIIAMVNAVNLNLEVKRLVLTDVLNLVTKEADKQIAKEIRENAESAHECELAEPSVNEHASQSN
jgi:hypothetical protein